MEYRTIRKIIREEKVKNEWDYVITDISIIQNTLGIFFVREYIERMSIEDHFGPVYEKFDKAYAISEEANVNQDNWESFCYIGGIDL